MGDTFNNITDSTIINRPSPQEALLRWMGAEVEPPWLLVDDGHSDYNSVHTWRHIASVEKKARVGLDEKVSQIRMYLADHGPASGETLEEGERAVLTDIAAILDGTP